MSSPFALYSTDISATTEPWDADPAPATLIRLDNDVDDADYQPPFPLTAKLNKLTIQVNRPQLSPEDIKKLEEGMTKAADAK